MSNKLFPWGSVGRFITPEGRGEGINKAKHILKLTPEPSPSIYSLKPPNSWQQQAGDGTEDVTVSRRPPHPTTSSNTAFPSCCPGTRGRQPLQGQALCGLQENSREIHQHPGQHLHCWLHHAGKSDPDQGAPQRLRARECWDELLGLAGMGTRAGGSPHPHLNPPTLLWCTAVS